jgi:hypothetical protein
MPTEWANPVVEIIDRNKKHVGFRLGEARSHAENNQKDGEKALHHPSSHVQIILMSIEPRERLQFC